MHLEVIRMVHDALEHATEGVNEQLRTLPVDAGDGDIPEVVAVLDPTKDDEATLDYQNLTKWPVLIVDIIQPAAWEGMVQTIHRDSELVPVQVAYVTAAEDSARRVRHTLYTMRAVVRSLRKWLDLDPNDARRKRNDIVVDSASEMIMERVELSLEAAVITGIVTVNLQVEDVQP